MARSLQDKLATLDAARRAGIEAEADRLHTEYLTLQELRKAKDLTQVQLAEAAVDVATAHHRGCGGRAALRGFVHGRAPISRSSWSASSPW